MQLFIPVLALLSTLVAAVPTASSDGRGATIFKDKNFKGQSTAIPANNFCTNINNIFGEFDGKIRSLTVEKGYQCKFYTAYDCPANGQKLESGNKDAGLGLAELVAFDTKIHSAYCTRL